MRQLNMQDIANLCVKLFKQGIDLSTLPVYLGDDDELNGVHCGWYCEVIDGNSEDENEQYLIEMINKRSGNNKLNGKGVLIS